MNLKRIKISLVLLLTLATVLVCCFSLTACGDESVSEIYVDGSSSPKLTYVEGQDLDLSRGAITVVIDGEESLVPLNAEGVTVSGYEKNTVGEQTLTVTYQECSTTMKVNVIARMTADGFKKEYFKDDPFDPSAGKIRIADDNASISTVNMNDAKISLVSFDSSSAGVKTVTVKYTSGDKVYECGFNVTVYDIESVTFTAPKKTEYKSHEEKLDLTRGYLTVTANSGKLVKYIDIVEETMISGKDFSLATPANRTNPYEQELTVAYAGYSFKYTVYITYSGISVIKDAFEALKDVDVSTAGETLTEEQGNIAVDAANEYFKLAATEKKSLDSEKVKALMVCASVYGMELYQDSLDDFSKIFTLTVEDEKITVSFVFGSSYEDVVSEIARIKLHEENINVYAPLLRNIKEEFKELMITEEKNAEEFLFVHTEENQELIVEIFEHFIDVYNLLTDIPTDWTDEDLERNADNILIAVTRISGAEFNSYRSLYNKILSPWREKNDLFDILYHYYLYLSDGSEKFLRDTMWENVPLPVGMSEWYNAMASATLAVTKLRSGNSGTYLMDLSEFMYARKLAEEACEKMKSTDNQFYLDLYEFFDGDYIYQHDINTLGYYHVNGSNVLSQPIGEVWDVYLQLLEIYVDKELDFEGNEELIQDLIDAFFRLSPSEVFGFLCSLNNDYGSSLGSVKVLDYTYDEEKESYTVRNVLTAMLAVYFDKTLGKENSHVFKTLFAAVESYANLGERITALDDFKAEIENLNDALKLLDEDTKAIFRTHLGTGYDKYLEIYGAVTDSVEIDLSSSAVKNDIDSFLLYADFVNRVNSYINSLDKDEDIDLFKGHSVLLAALYEHAASYYANILAEAKNDEELRLALATNLFVLDGQSLTLEQINLLITEAYDTFMFDSMVTITTEDEVSKTYTVWELYKDSTKELLKLHADLLYAAFSKDFSSIEVNYVTECITSFLSPTNVQYNLLNVFCGDDMFYDAYKAYFANIIGNDEKTLEFSEKLLNTHTSYCAYFVATKDKAEEAKEIFRSDFEAIKALNNSEINADFYETYLKALYDTLNEKYEALDTEEEA